jgi:hypothetical protein
MLFAIWNFGHRTPPRTPSCFGMRVGDSSCDRSRRVPLRPMTARTIAPSRVLARNLVKRRPPQDTILSLEDRWISSKLWKTGLQLSRSNSTKFSVRFKRWLELKLRAGRARRRVERSVTPKLPNGSSDWHSKKFGLRSASGSDAPRAAH